MSTEATPARKKLPIAKLAAGAVVAVAAAVLVMRGMDLKAVAEQGMHLIRSAGPWAFFGGIALLPSVGVPLSAFTLTAGEAFSRQMTLAGVLGAVAVGVLINLALTYWLARYALRPLLSRLTERYGYAIPRATQESALSIILVLRLTPGPPFCLQSYILGLAEVPFRLYMVASFVSIMPTVAAFVILGEGIFKGDVRLFMYGVGVVVAATAIFHTVRKRYGTKTG